VLAKEAKEHYGAYLSIRGGIFLVMFSQASGSTLAQRFVSISKNKPIAGVDRWRWPRYPIF